MKIPLAAAVALFISFSLCAQSLWPEALTITPEKSEFTKTSTYHDVLQFLEGLKSISQEIRTISMGKSLEGKEIPLAILASPSVANSREAMASGKPVIYIQGNIHAGEVEGKEAIMMLMREILLGKQRHLLENQIIMFAPIYNTDSNDKMEKGRRPSQEDSPLEVGLRENSRGLDLNRDGVKLEALETQGLITNILSTWDPQVFVDLHTTNGTWHAYSLTWAPSYHSAGENLTYALTVEMLREITKTMEDKHGLFLGPYGEYHLEEGWPPKNFYTYNHHPRYLVNQFGLRNRMAILSEAFSHERFYQRINSTYQFVSEILNYTNSHAKEIQSVNRQAEEATIKNVLENAGKVKKGVRFKMVVGDTLDDFKTYDYMSMRDPDGRAHLVRTAKIVSYDDVNYFGKFQPTTEATLPRGYIIPAEFANIVSLLKQHGIKVTQLPEPKRFSGELFLIDSLKIAEKKFEGHNMTTAHGRFLKASRTYKKGDFIIDLAQPLSNLIFYLMEPQSDDGLVTWNYFDAYLEKQNVNNKPVQYPVFKYIH